MVRVKRGLTVFGFFLLAAMMLLLFGFTTFEAWVSHWLGGVLLTTILVGAVVAVIGEWKAFMADPSANTDLAKLIPDIVAVLAGALAAYTLAHDVGLGPVVAAGVVGICAHLVAPQYAAAVYAGSFVGMTSDLLLLTHAEVLLASLVSGLVYTLTRPIFSGVGGKLGTIALIGTTLMSVGMKRIFLIAPLPDVATALEIMVISLIATPLTFYLSQLHGNGPVLASGVVGLVAGLVLHVIYPEMGTNLAVVAICASFAGMSGKDRLTNFWQVLAVAVFTGIVFIFSTPHLAGAGGKLGTIAFGSVLAVMGFRLLIVGRR